jgi:hypothetical protein
MRFCVLSATLVLLTMDSTRAGDLLWSHIHGAEDLGDRRGVIAEWQADGRLELTATGAPGTYAWADVPAPSAGWKLGRSASVEATIAARGDRAVETMLWVVADRGWESIGDVATLAPGEPRTFSCGLRQTFPDGTPKLSPDRIAGVRILLKKPAAGTVLEVTGLTATGDATEWQRPPGRIEMPRIEEGPPAAGRRVRYRPGGGAADATPGAAAILFLPEDWRPDTTYPVIVEYPGNIFFVAGCYSTGLPEQCAIGYGMSRGRGAIWVSLPFVEPSATDGTALQVAENGWGDPDATADFCIRVVDDICTNFGGDRGNLVLTGFSRGAIACGFIGLRHDRIAGLWKAFHCCQHYDGDGWNGATMEGALERARRFRGRALFHTDNPAAGAKTVAEAMGVTATFVRSGLGAHACAMFLDDRESTRQLQGWFEAIVATPATGGPGRDAATGADRPPPRRTR